MGNVVSDLCQRSLWFRAGPRSNYLGGHASGHRRRVERRSRTETAARLPCNTELVSELHHFGLQFRGRFRTPLHMLVTLFVARRRIV